MSWKRNTLIVFGLVAVGLQLVRVSQENGPVTAPLVAPPPVLAILRRSCYDCHSQETQWPWYSRIAPASWLIANDVNEGREHLDFSAWGQASRAQQHEWVEECLEAITEGEMPLAIYTPLHPEARLTGQDLATLRTWAQSEYAVGAQGQDQDDSE